MHVRAVAKNLAPFSDISHQSFSHLINALPLANLSSFTGRWKSYNSNLGTHRPPSIHWHHSVTWSVTCNRNASPSMPVVCCADSTSGQPVCLLYGKATTRVLGLFVLFGKHLLHFHKWMHFSTNNFHRSHQRVALVEVGGTGTDTRQALYYQVDAFFVPNKMQQLVN